MLTKKTFKKLHRTSIGAILLIISSCSEYLNYSVFDTDIKTQHYNARNTEELQSIPTNTDTLRFAFFSDSHDNYDELSALINSVNRQSNIKFVVSGGDITNFGLTWEFEKYLQLVRRIKVPTITAVGNHDYISNGITVYKRVFGPNNFSFTYGNYKFIVFDNVVWENGNRPLNFEWLNNEVASSKSLNIFISHLPFWDAQIDSTNNKKFLEIVNSGNTMLCLHGHTHNYKETKYNGIHTLVAGDLKDREYYILELIENKASIKRIIY